MLSSNKDIVGMPCIRSKHGNIKLNLKDKMKVWKEYEEGTEGILNEENEWSEELNVEKKEGLCEKVCKSSYGSIKSHENQKAAGPSGVAKMCKNEGVKKLAEVVDYLLQRKKMPESWRKSNLIPIYKGKGDVRSCGNSGL